MPDVLLAVPVSAPVILEAVILVALIIDAVFRSTVPSAITFAVAPKYRIGCDIL